jgi:hypothetical protein
MRQNVQKTIPVHLQPPYAQAAATLRKIGAPCLPPLKIPHSLLKFLFLLLPVPAPRPRRYIVAQPA